MKTFVSLPTEVAFLDLGSSTRGKKGGVKRERFFPCRKKGKRGRKGAGFQMESFFWETVGWCERKLKKERK